MHHETFVPFHMNIDANDIKGNNGIGRYILLPGSDGRAKQIASFFEETEVKSHPRQHNFYKGVIRKDGLSIDVATIASGMGCPSIDIIVTELYKLGARRIIRIGTAGSMQPDYIRVGSIVIPTAATRDESTSLRYLPRDVPAVASFEITKAASRAAKELGLQDKTFYGPVHTKDSLYAREFKEGPMAQENHRYMELQKACGILASEMECSMLFALGMVRRQQLRLKDKRAIMFYTGAILSIVGDDTPFSDKKAIDYGIEDSIKLSLETIVQLAKKDTSISG